MRLTNTNNFNYSNDQFDPKNREALTFEDKKNNLIKRI